MILINTILTVDGSFWFYAPNQGATIFFLFAFLTSGLIHVWQTMCVHLGAANEYARLLTKNDAGTTSLGYLHCYFPFAVSYLQLALPCAHTGHFIMTNLTSSSQAFA